MDESFDVAIVGAGPAGISAACVLADRGIKTIVFERGEFPGAKNIFGGVLYGHDLSQIVPDYMDKGFPMERNIVESRIWYLSQRGDTASPTATSLFPRRASSMHSPRAGPGSTAGTPSRQKRKAPCSSAARW